MFHACRAHIDWQPPAGCCQAPWSWADRTEEEVPRAGPEALALPPCQVHSAPYRNHEENDGADPYLSHPRSQWGHVGLGCAWLCTLHDRYSAWTCPVSCQQPHAAYALSRSCLEKGTDQSADVLPHWGLMRGFATWQGSMGAAPANVMANKMVDVLQSELDRVLVRSPMA